MNSEDFVENFITECITKGIKAKKAICEAAKAEMDEINVKLREFNNLRIRYKNLKSVLREFNHESLKRTKNDENTVFYETVDINDSPYYDSLIEICEFINNSNSIVTSREIMDAVGSRENSQIIYSCIKILAENGIISRNEDRHIIKGPNWDNRPIKLANKIA